ncbi:MAG TPA: MgtC/SapB family protein [Acidobacteriaceae bacterium]|nr:MgtC/SapB family protein [Acidobacteriaceae bacterium]
MQNFPHLPPDAVKIVLVLFLSFLIGLEREDYKSQPGRYSFGGVRTFPLIGLLGYSLALLSGNQLLPLTIGFLVVAGFLLLSYWHKLSQPEAAGVTTEMSGLTTFVVGALVCYGHFWIATTLSVASLLLLDLKVALEKLAGRVAPREILTFAKFLLLTGVILPVLPRQEFTRFHINPFKTWLVVVAISAISYGSYILQKITKSQGGVVVAALLGGAYSSTVTTIVMARRSKQEEHPHLFSGGILIASGVMYVRLAVLLALFNRQMMALVDLPFLVLAALAILTGWLWTRRADPTAQSVQREFEPSNPLELGAAFLFAAIFLAMLIATQLAVTYVGRTGVNTLAAIMGFADVDPFILGMTQAAGTLILAKTAAAGALIAASSNNIAKGIYAWSFAHHRTGLQSFIFLVSLALLGLIPLFWIL